MKRLISSAATNSMKIDSELRLLSKELKEKVKDDNYSYDALIREYGELLTVFHNREIRRKLKSINSILIYFGVIVTFGLIIALFGGLL